jgi:hypothetical protein
MRRATRCAAAGVLFMTLAGCGQDGTPTTPSSQAITSEVRAALERSIQDEYRAETIYQGVVNDFGSVLPFVNILQAEQRHSAALAQLFVRRGLAVPPSGWTLANVPRFDSVRTACAASALAEVENVAMYDELLRLDLPSDVRQVFGNNRLASLEQHLPAFERCS